MFFGPDGQIEGSIDYLIGVLNAAGIAALTMIGRIKAAISGISKMKFARSHSTWLTPTTSTGGSGSGGTFEKAEGGTHLVTRPTLFQAGEAGPEIASFTPLNRSGRDVNKLFSDSGTSMRNTNPSRVVIGLKDGLVADIVDTAVGAAGNVIIDIQRVER